MEQPYKSRAERITEPFHRFPRDSLKNPRIVNWYKPQLDRASIRLDSRCITWTNAEMLVRCNSDRESDETGKNGKACRRRIGSERIGAERIGAESRRRSRDACRIRIYTHSRYIIRVMAGWKSNAISKTCMHG